LRKKHLLHLVSWTTAKTMNQWFWIRTNQIHWNHNILQERNQKISPLDPTVIFLSPLWDFAMQMSEFLSGSLQKLDTFWTQKVHLKMKSTAGSLCGVFWFRSWRVWSCFHWIWLFLIQNHLFITFSVFSLTSCSRCFFLKDPVWLVIQTGFIINLTEGMSAMFGQYLRSASKKKKKKKKKTKTKRKRDFIINSYHSI